MVAKITLIVAQVVLKEFPGCNCPYTSIGVNCTDAEYIACLEPALEGFYPNACEEFTGSVCPDGSCIGYEGECLLMLLFINCCLIYCLAERIFLFFAKHAIKLDSIMVQWVLLVVALVMGLRVSHNI